MQAAHTQKHGNVGLMVELFLNYSYAYIGGLRNSLHFGRDK